MSILNVNQIQPVGGGNTITVSASDVSASGATITASSFVGNITGNITGNVTSSSTSEFSSGLNVTGGSVGIGTDNPDSIFHLESSVPRFTLSDTGTNAHHRINADSSVGNFGLEVDYDSATSTPAFFVKIKGDEKLRITSTGSVGIGTDDPQEDLHIGSNSPYILLDDYDNSRKWKLKGTAWFAIEDTTAGEDRLRIMSDGKVGIGSDNPGNKLDVAGDVKILDNSPRLFLYDANATGASNATGGFEVFDKDGNKNVFVGAFAPNADNLIFGVTGSERARITSDGNVAIGTDTTDRQLAIYHDTQATIELKSSDTGQSSLWFTDLSDGNIGGVYYTHNNNKMELRVNDSSRMYITSTGDVGIGHADPNTRLYVKDTGADISNGNAILNSTQKGIRLEVDSNDDKSLGLWFTTGSHHSGISGQRSAAASNWGTDLRFYTHEGATNDLTYTRERIRLSCNGLLNNRKGNNAINTGGTILGRYKYTQQNQSQNYEHNILGPDGRNLNNYLTQNVYARIRIQVTGTGTTPCFCEYVYTNNSSVGSAALNNIRGNSSASSNRPYMVLNGQLPAWKMNHGGGYILDIEVAMYGGKEGYTYTTEYGNFGANP